MAYPNDPRPTQGEILTILTHAPSEPVKALAESIIDYLGPITVVQSRTGLVMLPHTDSVRGTQFHLGEVLVSEAHIRLENGAEGYAVCLGRDLEQAMAVAVLDAALGGNIAVGPILAFVDVEQRRQRAADEALLKQVETTRVQMETF